MAAAEKNKYAEKWTKELALEFITEVEGCILKGAYYHIGKATVAALEKFTKKHPEVISQERFIWSYLTRKFNGDKQVSNAIKKAEETLEGKVVEDTLRGEIKSAAMAIFYLKNKFGWKDKSEQEINLRGSISVEKWLESARDDQG